MRVTELINYAVCNRAACGCRFPNTLRMMRRNMKMRRMLLAKILMRMQRKVALLCLKVCMLATILIAAFCFTNQMSVCSVPLYCGCSHVKNPFPVQAC